MTAWPAGDLVEVGAGPDPVGASGGALRLLTLSARLQLGTDDLGVEPGRGGAGELPDGIDELLGGHAAGQGAAKDVGVVVGFVGNRRRAGLVDVGSADQRERVLQVVAVLGEIDGEKIEQVGAPGLGVHRIDRMDDAAAHQAVPEAVDDRPREAAVVGVRHQRRELLQPLRLRGRGVDLAQLGKDPGGLGGLAGRLVAAVDRQRLRGVDRGQAVRVARASSGR